VSQSEPRIELFRRLPSGSWEYSETTEGTLTLADGAVIDLGRLYADPPP